MRRLIVLFLLLALLAGLYLSVIAFTEIRPVGEIAGLENRVGELGERVRRRLGLVEQEVALLTAGHVTFSMQTFRLDPRPSNYGGAFFQVADEIYLVGGKGEIGRYAGGQFEPVETQAPINYDDFLSGIADTEFDFWETKAHFRVNDAFARPWRDGHELIVLHHYWLSDVRRKVVRLSRLRFDQTSDLSSAGPEKWETLLECRVRIEPSANVASPFATNRTGGRIIEDTRDADRPLLVSVADHGFDGVDASLEGLEGDSCFGKILRIDSDTGQWDVYASGFRNPSGLLLGSQGRLWETEHGPRGGDEFNLIEPSVDYGWPSVTYGTEYDAPFIWPPNPQQGRHEGFQKPLVAWVPSIGVSNLIEIKNGPPEWQGDLLIASLRAGNLYRARIAEERVIVLEPIPIGHRIRDLIQLKDGRLLLWTDSWTVIELSPETELLAEDLLPVPLTEQERDLQLTDLLARCTTCHALQQRATPTAPSLHGIHGRRVGSTDFGYSEAMREHGGQWNKKDLVEFISNPAGSIPGTTMPYSGLTRDEAQQVVGYLIRLD